MIRRVRQWYGSLASLTHDPMDVPLNQPGRALARCALWWAMAVAFGSFPLGLLVVQLPSTIDIVNYTLGNLAGLLLSGMIWLLLYPLVVTIAMWPTPCCAAVKSLYRPWNGGSSSGCVHRREHFLGYRDCLRRQRCAELEDLPSGKEAQLLFKVTAPQLAAIPVTWPLDQKRWPPPWSQGRRVMELQFALHTAC